MNIYISIRGQEKGPYDVSQVEAMWKNGTITADATYRKDGSKEWHPVRELISFKSKVGRIKSPISLNVVRWLVVVGVAVALTWYLSSQHKAKVATDMAVQQVVGNVMADPKIQNIVKQVKMRKEMADTFKEETAKAMQPNAQGILDEDYYQTIGKVMGYERGASGLTAQSLTVMSVSVLASALQLFHDSLPCALHKGGVAGCQVGAGKVQV